MANRKEIREKKRSVVDWPRKSDRVFPDFVFRGGIFSLPSPVIIGETKRVKN